jgi:hypothetical protein
MGLLDPLLRKVLHIAGVALPERGKWDIVSGATAVDNPITKTTEITITGAGPSVAIAAMAIDWSLGSVFYKTLAAGANTFTFSNATDGQCIIVEVTGATSTLTWPTVKWPGGTIPTQTSEGTDVYTFVKRGSIIFGSVVQAMASAPAPNLTSISPTSGTELTAVGLTLTGTDFVTGCTVKVNGVAATSVSFVSSTSVTCNTPTTLAAGGPYSVQITNPDTQTDTLASAYTANAAAAGLAAMPLTLYLEADYTGSPWTSTASAGTSGARTVTEATNPPAAGTDLNATGKNAADFDGTNDHLTLAGGLVLSDLVTAATGGILIVYKADAGQAVQAANATADVDLISDSGGYLAIGVSASMVSAYVYDAGDKQIDLAATHDGATWNKVFMRWDAGLLEASINGGALSTLAAGSLGAVSGTVNIGKAYGAHFFPGEIKVVATWATKPSNADLTAALADILAEYGI